MRFYCATSTRFRDLYSSFCPFDHKHRLPREVSIDVRLNVSIYVRLNVSISDLLIVLIDVSIITLCGYI